jgi:hypothetical protein
MSNVSKMSMTSLASNCSTGQAEFRSNRRTWWWYGPAISEKLEVRTWILIRRSETGAYPGGTDPLCSGFYLDSVGYVIIAATIMNTTGCDPTFVA